MKIDVDTLVLIVLFLSLMAGGAHLLLNTRRIMSRFSDEQKSRGRRFLANYELGLTNYFVIKFIGMALIAGPGYLLWLMLSRLLQHAPPT